MWVNFVTSSVMMVGKVWADQRVSTVVNATRERIASMTFARAPMDGKGINANVIPELHALEMEYVKKRVVIPTVVSAMLIGLEMNVNFLVRKAHAMDMAVVVRQVSPKSLARLLPFVFFSISLLQFCFLSHTFPSLLGLYHNC